jgi:YVTN family beta-propeller protein
MFDRDGGSNQTVVGTLARRGGSDTLEAEVCDLVHARPKRCVRTVLAGSLLFGGALTALVISEAQPASAAEVIQTIPVGSLPVSVSSDGTHVWVANEGAETVTELKASTGSIVRTITIPETGYAPDAISSDGTHVWVTSGGISYQDVTELNASNGSIVQTIELGYVPVAVSSDGTHVWLTSGGLVTELNASTGSIVQTIHVMNNAIAISSDGTNVWIANRFQTVTQLNASTGSVVRTVTVGTSPADVSTDGTHAWVTTDNTLDELNASTGVIGQTIFAGNGPEGVSSDGTHVWVADSSDNAVSELDASTGIVVQTIPVGSDPVAVSSDGTHAWVVNNGGNSVSEIGIKDTPTTPTISNLPGSGFVGSGFTATVSTTGDGGRSVTSSTTGVCTASGLVISYIGAGTCTLTAHVAAGTNYTAADGSPQSLTIYTLVKSVKCSSFTGLIGETGTFSHCGDRANTGGSGTMPLDSTTGGTITWASPPGAQGTTSISFTLTAVGGSGQPTDEHEPESCPTGSQEDELAGTVQADTGKGVSIPVGGTVTAEVCQQGESFSLEPGTRFVLR